MNSKFIHQKEKVIVPDWYTRFQCWGGACPNTCCQRWNIPVDQPHAEWYQTITDEKIAPLLNTCLRTISRRQNKSKKKEIYLHLLQQPNQICPLLDENQLCSLQKQWGAEALCDTCYFFPKFLFQIDETWFASASLSCPAICELVLSQNLPAQFIEINTEVDPSAFWIETETISDQRAKMLFRHRKSFIAHLVKHVHSSKGDFVSKLNSFTMFQEYPPFSNEPEQWIPFFQSIFCTGYASSPQPIQSSHHIYESLLSGEESPTSIAVANFNQANTRYLAPFFTTYPSLLLNFITHIIITESLRTWVEAMTETTIMRYEKFLLVSIYRLFMIHLAAISLKEKTMTPVLFQTAVMAFDRSFLHDANFFVSAWKSLAKSNIF